MLKVINMKLEKKIISVISCDFVGLVLVITCFGG